MGTARHLVVATLGLAAFGGVAAFAVSGASAPLDVAIMQAAPSLHGAVGDALAVLVADGLGVYGLVPLTALVAAAFFFRGRRLDALVLGVTMLAATGLMAGLKHLFARPRPELFTWLDDPGGFSFPSGHAMLNAVFWLLLAGLVNRPWAWTLGVLMALFSAAMRVVAGVHWPTDVTAGLALGVAVVALALAVRRRLGPPPSRAPDEGAA